MAISRTAPASGAKSAESNPGPGAMLDAGRLPASFTRYTLGLALAVLGSLAAVSGQDLDPALSSTELWVLAGLTCAVELLPIRLVRRHSIDSVTVSSAFALAVLFSFG